MPTFTLTAQAPAPVEEVWKLLHDPARFPEWWAGVETVRTGTDGDYTLWPAGYPDFPMAQHLGADATDAGNLGATFEAAGRYLRALAGRTGVLLYLVAAGAAIGAVTYAWQQVRRRRDCPRARVVDSVERTWRRYE